MPVSMMYAFTPKPVGVYVYELLSGRSRWSTRSRPHGGALCVVVAVMTWSASTYATSGSLRTSASAAGGSAAA
jgi:hypothetical protein